MISNSHYILVVLAICSLLPALVTAGDGPKYGIKDLLKIKPVTYKALGRDSLTITSVFKEIDGVYYATGTISKLKVDIACGSIEDDNTANNNLKIYERIRQFPIGESSMAFYGKRYLPEIKDVILLKNNKQCFVTTSKCAETLFMFRSQINLLSNEDAQERANEIYAKIKDGMQYLFNIRWFYYPNPTDICINDKTQVVLSILFHNVKPTHKYFGGPRKPQSNQDYANDLKVFSQNLLQVRQYLGIEDAHDTHSSSSHAQTSPPPPYRP
ncbi:hypothetical protein BDF19DRAFT_443983 [Syncephalis fuscata]|nr:hypothetical protein BDF19DRAFT_443983 [Syncephalis fuscata]